MKPSARIDHDFKLISLKEFSVKEDTLLIYIQYY
jgi:hypothetical protein